MWCRFDEGYLEGGLKPRGRKKMMDHELQDYDEKSFVGTDGDTDADADADAGADTDIDTDDGDGDDGNSVGGNRR
jgi:hypothetical protein